MVLAMAMLDLDMQDMLLVTLLVMDMLAMPQLIAHPNGAVVPLDEPAVAAARAAHLDTQAA